MAGDRMTTLPQIEVRVVAHTLPENIVDAAGNAKGVNVTLQYRDRLGYPETFAVWCAQDEAPPIGSRHTLQAIAA